MFVLIVLTGKVQYTTYFLIHIVGRFINCFDFNKRCTKLQFTYIYLYYYVHIFYIYIAKKYGKPLWRKELFFLQYIAYIFKTIYVLCDKCFSANCPGKNEWIGYFNPCSEPCKNPSNAFCSLKNVKNKDF